MIRNSLWSYENRMLLHQGGEAYYAALMVAIHEAKFHVRMETYIYEEDEIGLKIANSLKLAAMRGVNCEIVIDGFGSKLSSDLLESLKKAGVRVFLYRPLTDIFMFGRQIFRRNHRKVVTIDAKRSFVGGINVGKDYLMNAGPNCKMDYTLQVDGPLAERIFLVQEIFFARLSNNLRRYVRARKSLYGFIRKHRHDKLPIRAAYILRSNFRYRRQIEIFYRKALRSSKSHVLIANAYFVPGYRLQRELKNAAQRGVKVQLILQGKAEYRVVKWASQAFYETLLRAGIEIYEYMPRQLHAKIASFDSRWSTVGSCNLDPLSLFLNLEANVVVDDENFSAKVTGSLQNVILKDCKRIELALFTRMSVFHRLKLSIGILIVRYVPSLSGFVPARVFRRSE